MSETPFQRLSANDRRLALQIVHETGKHRSHLLEKDIWIVAILNVLFNAPFAEYLTFKGGTSLSKVWQAIRRFSEDIDITYDIRAFAPDLVSGTGDEALPSTRSQQKRWTNVINTQLAEWVRDKACPIVEQGLFDMGFAPKCRVDANRLYVAYEPMFDASDFIQPQVIVEFGARSTGEPHETRSVVCDAAAHLPDLAFPEAQPSVMLAERTFWEKATAAHVFCRQERRRGERLSRHWHDLVRLDEAGIAASALVDRELANSVARHKSVFFVENDSRGERIDYQAAVSGQLQLVPSGAAYAELADDYAAMVAGDILLDDDKESFDGLMERCAQLEARANETNI